MKKGKKVSRAELSGVVLVLQIQIYLLTKKGACIECKDRVSRPDKVVMRQLFQGSLKHKLVSSEKRRDI